MLPLANFNNDFNKIHLVLCMDNEKDEFINYISNLPKYKNFSKIIYQTKTNIKNNSFLKIESKKNLKYKNTIIFSSSTTMKKGFSLQSIGKFKTPIFLLIGNQSSTHVNAATNFAKSKSYNIIVSPNFSEKYENYDFIGLGKNDIEHLTKFSKWIFVNIRIDL